VFQFFQELQAFRLPLAEWLPVQEPVPAVVPVPEFPLLAVPEPVV
jgi:hypothetical protein